MGAKNSTIAQDKLETIATGSEVIEKGVESLETTFKNFTKDFFTREEIEIRLKKVQDAQNSSSDKLGQLIEFNKEQQQVIFDLGGKYSQLSDDYCKQQKMFIEMTGRYEDKFNRYEECLFEARSKLHELEKEVIASAEFGKVLGIRRSENMIKKEKISVKPEKKTQEKSKAREKLQNARNLKKMEKELQAAKEQEALLAKQDISQTSTDLYDSNSSLDRSGHERSKDALVEVDMSNF